MKALLSFILVGGFAALANAQVSAPAGADLPLRAAPAVTVLRASSLTLHLGSGTRIDRDARFELLGPREIRADEAEYFASGFPDERLRSDDLLILRGNVVVRSNPHVK